MMYLSLFFQDSKNSNLKTSVVFGEGVAPCRQCTSMLLVIPPLGFVFPENCEVPEVGDPQQKLENNMFFFQTENITSFQMHIQQISI